MFDKFNFDFFRKTEKADYISRLNKARRKRGGSEYIRYALLAAAALVVLVLLVIGARAIVRQVRSGNTGQADPGMETQTGLQEEQSTENPAVAAARELEEQESRIDQVLDGYTNLGLVQVSGYLNVRETPQSDGRIIGKLMENSGCEILGSEGEWYHISSGGIEGYIHSQYVLTGDAARTAARDFVKLRAIVTADNLNIRSEPTTDNPANIVAQALKDERYEVVDQLDGWIQIPSGYISADYCTLEYCLNEARSMDLLAQAINQYDNLVISKVNSYLNIRSEPKENGTSNVIGKFPSKAAGEILETVDGWYKIKSGSLVGYISADSQYTAVGQEARDLAMQGASLMAIVNTDRLNVRTEPSTEATIWTQISKEERYPVVRQLDGWVQIELDTGESEGSVDAAYISTRDNNVEVRYALPEAIKFSPLEEAANAASSRRSQIVNFALRYVGNPYVWGGTSLTNGADCSGFVQSVMKNFGVSLPRTSREQARTGKSIKSSEMRPGDLIFYTNSSGTVNHVAMYIGNGQVVHAASRRSGIKISTWNYRTPKYIRNVLGN